MLLVLAFWNLSATYENLTENLQWHGETSHHFSFSRAKQHQNENSICDMTIDERSFFELSGDAICGIPGSDL